MNFLALWLLLTGIAAIVSAYVPSPFNYLLSGVGGGASLGMALVTYLRDKEEAH